jgi:hypothetical protein
VALPRYEVRRHYAADVEYMKCRGCGGAFRRAKPDTEWTRRVRRQWKKRNEKARLERDRRYRKEAKQRRERERAEQERRARENEAAERVRIAKEYEEWQRRKERRLAELRAGATPTINDFLIWPERR